ncbi:MAG: hypothetical protein US42_C0006G0040 [Candidatus Magasanikbacteria bacterium GW2011_GWC2_37_14]|uniref:Uncharacterized protein n=1 Tax=Candidatus Magasanikbacteria bacterium GW2011_GWC2_37_14 TaxID=1619046 RepID=A0A0G0G9F9_9BACT|nr:MAG: hypothetical protein US42_C0006G0040 [Candidatus Magasanikbacteria bacterium GW2011_GWC2_37_14]
MGKFKGGLLLGGLLGAGFMWLTVTKKGKEVREKLLDQAAEVYENLKKQVLVSPQYQKLSKSEYVTLVKEYVDKYAIQNGLAENAKNMVIKIVSAQWQNLQNEIKK